MKRRVSDLGRWDGTLDRGPFAVLGLLMTALKYTLDRAPFSSLGGTLDHVKALSEARP